MSKLGNPWSTGSWRGPLLIGKLIGTWQQRPSSMTLQLPPSLYGGSYFFLQCFLSLQALQFLSPGTQSFVMIGVSGTPHSQIQDWRIYESPICPFGGQLCSPARPSVYEDWSHIRHEEGKRSWCKGWLGFCLRLLSLMAIIMENIKRCWWIPLSPVPEVWGGGGGGTM